MLDKKTVSQCISADYCRGWNDAVDAMPRWISVEERLPEVNTGVLVAVRHMQTGQFSVRYDWRIKTTERGWWWKKTSESNISDLLDVTHWMPLPEPPKED